MAEMNPHKPDELAPSTPASSPDDLIKDLSLEVSEADQNSVTGGKGGTTQQEYLIVKLKEVIITGV
jgi:hypothetical protein